MSQLTELNNLTLWETKLDDAGLALLTPLVHLTELNLEATNLSNDAVPTLLKLQNLERLNIAGTRIDDEGIRQLTDGLPNLQWINLANTGASLDLLDELLKKDGLEFVD